jgi:predicted Rossmann fold flavoprotein
MMAAVIAAGEGGRVRLWEKNGSLGRKLLATGNGRCNLSNYSLKPGNYHGGGAGMAHEMMNVFGVKEAVGFFQGLGLSLYTDEKGRYFPRSNEASSVLFCLEREMKRLNIEVNLRSEIIDIARDKSGLEIHQRGQAHRSDALIMACGGAAGPQFGSNGGGYRMAAKLSHSLINPRPALVPLTLEGNWFHKLQGLRMDLKLTICHETKTILEIIDEGLFTQYGLSGPLALRSSRELNNNDAKCRISFLPDLSTEEAGVLLYERRDLLGDNMASGFLTGLLPEKLAQIMLSQSWQDLDQPCSSITDLQLQRLLTNLCNWEIKIKGFRPFKEAQVTAGGIDCRQIFQESLMSKKCPGLFFCGEVLDVDGDTGGYNLQWCWSSGYVAGKSARKYANQK